MNPIAMRVSHSLITGIAPWILLFPATQALAAEPLKAKSVAASSEMAGHPASKALDGATDDGSRWVSRASDDPAWLVVEFASPQKIAGMHLYTGYQSSSAITDFEVQMDQKGKWVTIPSSVTSGNTAVALSLPFDATMQVETTKLRLWITGTHQKVARVKEWVLWPGEPGAVPGLPKNDPGGLVCRIPHTEILPLYLNQSGFNTGKPKRFTAPTLADGTAFEVRPSDGGSAVFRGKISGGKGDFSAFEPGDDREYVVAAGDLVSVPFRVAPFLFERSLYQNAVNFMIDSRHYVGNDRNRCNGSFGWRDDHHFGWELHTLVPQYLSNPAAYESMPRQVKYEKASDPKLWGALEPYREDAPDIVKLIHWGADVIVTQKVTHEHLKAQLAYFLYAWPVLEPWLPRQNYEVVSEFAHRTWAEASKDHSYPYDESPEHNLLALKTKVGSTKGSYPPGFSVEPNLLMHEVALREERKDAARYLDAATRQVEWMVKNLDWNDPQVTKGQRMSEFITMTGLAHYLRRHPDKAPAGLQKKIEEWAEVAVRRSKNMWDFRKLDDKDRWTPMGEKPQMWNEPGNITGFPAALLAAREFVRPQLQAQLDVLIWSHIDNFFGRNPVGRHFCFHAPREIKGVEYGWFNRYPGGIGRLAKARFVIDGAPKNQHYPHHPEVGNVGWTEGWIQFNTPLNLSLAYLAWSELKMEVKAEAGKLHVRLEGPLNFDDEKTEAARVEVTSGLWDREGLTLKETTPDSGVFEGDIVLQPDGERQDGDQSVQFRSGTFIKVSYGFGYLGQSAVVKP
ncbi:MAG: discoidin domain-containing protein [Akkermansiaceae bacterium]|jgi:hypothetical protein|nr:discoidin domain-containing protein [Akkermansiaceae bacterium]